MVAAFVTDAFTGTNGTVLSSHTPDVGSAWAEHANYATDIVINTNRAISTLGAGVSAVYYNTTAPPSADCMSSCDIKVLTDNDNSAAGPAVRVQSGANSLYFARLNSNGNVIQLFKTVAGTTTQIGSNVATSVVDMNLALSVNGTTLKVYKDGVEIISQTDAAISTAGFAGIRLTGGTSSTVGLVVDNFSAAPIHDTGTVSVGTASASGLSVTGTAGQGVTGTVSVGSAAADGTTVSATAGVGATGTVAVGSAVADGTTVIGSAGLGGSGPITGIVNVGTAAATGLPVSATAGHGATGSVAVGTAVASGTVVAASAGIGATGIIAVGTAIASGTLVTGTILVVMPTGILIPVGAGYPDVLPALTAQPAITPGLWAEPETQSALSVTAP